MQVRKLTQKERPEAGLISTVSFHGRIDNMDERVARWEADTTENWGAFDDDGTMMGHIVNNRFQCYFDGHVVECGGIGGVSALPEYRESAPSARFSRACCQRPGGTAKSFRRCFRSAIPSTGSSAMKPLATERTTRFRRTPCRASATTVGSRCGGRAIPRRNTRRSTRRSPAVTTRPFSATTRGWRASISKATATKTVISATCWAIRKARPPTWRFRIPPRN